MDSQRDKKKTSPLRTASRAEGCEEQGGRGSAGRGSITLTAHQIAQITHVAEQVGKWEGTPGAPWAPGPGPGPPGAGARLAGQAEVGAKGPRYNSARCLCVRCHARFIAGGSAPSRLFLQPGPRWSIRRKSPLQIRAKQKVDPSNFTSDLAPYKFVKIPLQINRNSVIQQIRDPTAVSPSQISAPTLLLINN